jgi:hypothetical protein
MGSLHTILKLYGTSSPGKTWRHLPTGWGTASGLLLLLAASFLLLPSASASYTGAPVTVNGHTYGGLPGDFATVATDLTAPLAVVMDGAQLGTACSPLPAGSLAGQIALISSGTCSFSTKIRNAQDTGALAVLMVNNVIGDPVPMGQDGTPNQPTIPAYMLSKPDGLALVPANGAAVTISAAMAFFQTPYTTTTISAATGQYSDKVTLSATVSPDAAGGSVQFWVNGAAVGSPVSVSSGAASLDYTIDLPAASYIVEADFTSSDAAYANSEGTSTLTVTPEDASLAPDPNNPLAVQVNVAGGTAGPITLKVALTEWQNGPGQVSGTIDELGDICGVAVPVTVTLTPVVGGGSFTATASEITCAGGKLIVQATFNQVPVNVYEVSFSGGGNYYSGSANSVLAVSDPSLGFVSGGGWINRGGGVWGEFAANVKYLNKGVQGGLLYIDHELTEDVRVKSNSMQSLSIVGNTGIVTSKATVAGVGNFWIQAVLVDNGQPGVGVDQFGLKVVAPNSAVVSDLTFGPLTLVGGNIQVPHLTGKK